MSYFPSQVDVLVVGSGNAGYSAAISAAQSGARRVLVIDRAPESWAGGNSYFSEGTYRVAHGGLDELKSIVNNVSSQQANLGPYSEQDFLNDMDSNSELAETLAADSYAAVQWLAGNGVQFQLSEANDGSLQVVDGGKGLMADHQAAAERHLVQFSFSTMLSSIQTDANGSSLVTVDVDGMERTIMAGAVVLAAGGFEANPELRGHFLGSNSEQALVRGTPFNTGDVLDLAINSLGAESAGDWSAFEAVAWDANANPLMGDREAGNENAKSSHALGLMLNVDGARFVDEGASMHNSYGLEVLQQPGQVAFQVYDAQTFAHLQSNEYHNAEYITASTLEELADQCMGQGLRNRDAFVQTIKEYNEAVYAHQWDRLASTWNPIVQQDGLSTTSSTNELALPKSNWALPISQGPFLAVKVGCGITSTLGGLRVVPQTAQLISAETGMPMPGLYAAGAMIGGLFSSNAPAGSGLTSGAVFGRRAGKAAAQAAAEVTRSITSDLPWAMARL